MAMLVEEKKHKNNSKQMLTGHEITSDSLIYLVQNHSVLSPVLKNVLTVPTFHRGKYEEKEQEEVLVVEAMIYTLEDSVSFLVQIRTILALALLGALIVASLLSLMVKSL